MSANDIAMKLPAAAGCVHIASTPDTCFEQVMSVFSPSLVWRALTAMLMMAELNWLRMAWIFAA